MRPPYSITPAILRSVASISRKLGEVHAAHLSLPSARVRKDNRIHTIQSTLEIEGNTLGPEQVTALLEGSRVAAPAKDLMEVRNAIAVYDRLHRLKPRSENDFLKSHADLMRGLVKTPGRYRTSGVGIMKGQRLAHLPPSGDRVQGLMHELFDYVKKDDDLDLIKSCVFHYELEFIHPFQDGNGRMGRLWQTVILIQQHAVFAYLPVEALVRSKQRAYYMALNDSDKSGSSTPFITFMLEQIDGTLEELLSTSNRSLEPSDRLLDFKAHIGDRPFSRKDYLRFFKHISMATAGRDLKLGVERKLLKRQGEKRMTVYTFKG